SGSPATDYPGDAQSTDQVNIGVNVDYTNSPVISATLPNLIATLTFGDRLITGAATATNTLTINSGVVLSVTGQILQKHTTAGVLNSGFTAQVSAIQTYLQGSGTINCASLAVGDNTTPTANGVVNISKVILGAAAGGNTPTLNITGDLSINTQCRNNAGNTQILSNSDAQFLFTQGTLTLGGQIKLADAGANSYPDSKFRPASVFSMDLYNNNDSPVLNLQNAQALVSDNGDLGNKFDFYNVVQAGGSGTTTVNYTGTTNQEVYNYVSGSTVNNYVDNDVVEDDYVIYQNLGFSGSGTKTVDADSPGTLIVGRDFTLAAGTEVVDFATNNCALLVGNNYTTGTGSTFNAGTRPVFISASFANSGTSNFGTSLVTFNSGAEETLSTVNPQSFTNLAFAGGGVYDMNAGSFQISCQGVLTMSNFSQLNAGGKLTLNSDATGSASIAAIPSDCAINGVVNVQRYVNAYRSYRLVSSPVTDITATGDAALDANGNKIYSINYLLDNTYLVGTSGVPGGFDKAGNPTLYLFRENLVPNNSTFTGGNFRGIGYIGNSPSYTIDNDGQNYSIPVGNGYLFFFRGSRKQKTLAQLTVVGAAATTDTLNAKGLLNQGTITVSHWYTGTPGLLYTGTSGNPAIDGFNLVGNPYASSIDWDTFSDSNPSAPIYGPGLSSIIALLNPTGQVSSGNYGYYVPGVGGTNNATNIIPSGVGFFVQATPGGANTLTFTEAAKINTQPAALSLFMAKKPPVASVKQSIRLQMVADSVNTDETLINFNANAKLQYNAMEDARYRVGTGKVSLASLSADQAPLGINQLPWAKQRIIRLKVSATASGNYTLKLKDIQGIPQLYTVSLKDAGAKDSVDLRKTGSYSFAVNTADTATFGSNRLSLVISENPSLMYKLVSFDAKKTIGAQQVELQWKTENEENYTRFTLERSTDNGKTFNVIKGFTSNDAGSYSYLDKNPSYGMNFYRLKQEDIDNNITYSQTQQIDIINRENRVICVYPNPAKHTINLCITTKTRNIDRYNILVTNSSGIIVRQVLSSQADWQSNISSLLTGTYLVRVINSKDKSLVGEAKFVKL
ncbi:MAG TPA: T9SS type A sorting domain-containing protein, partial [Mucilaginibacter sp.]|nr:T9SS type A sorting domain-containing protein [Mucilaginibacter sp.]